MGAAVALASLLLLGLVERLLRDRARAAIPIRIHVNGTRGKSTVTRLIRGALAEAGIPALAKTTGTEARLILPDGREQPILRRGRANIREQLWALRVARRVHARAVVLECMAVRPELQWVAEHRMVRATIGVITNVRSDHAEVMGRTLAEVAASLANTIPRRGLLVTGEAAFLDCFREEAAGLGTTVRLAARGAAAADLPAWWNEDAALALEVTRALGVPDGVALVGMRRAVPDPGAAREVPLEAGLAALDASAANDPESLRLLLAPYLQAGRHLVFVFNHRADRPERLRTFLGAGLPGEVVITGETPGAVRRGFRPRRTVRYLPRHRLGGWLAALAGATGEAPLVVFCGNSKGLAFLRQGEPGKEFRREGARA